MFSLFIPIFLILANASFTVIFIFKSINSVVIIVPAESSGYFKSSLITSLSFLGTPFKIRFTTFEGISSIKSTVSSIYKSSTTCFNSLSVNEFINFSCKSGSKYEKTSAASSFGSNLKTLIISSSSISSNKSAISCTLNCSKYCCKSEYFLLSVNSKTFSFISIISSFITITSNLALKFYHKKGI